MLLDRIVRRVTVGSVVYTAATWSARPATANDGDVLRLTNSEGVFVWWSGAAGLWNGSGWIPAEIYGRTPILDIYLTGTVAPATEGWTVTTSGTGTVTSDGTIVDCNGSTAAGDTAFIRYTHGITGGAYWMLGLVQAIYHDANQGQAPAWRIADGQRLQGFLLTGPNTDKLAYWADNGGLIVGSRRRDENLVDTERLLLITVLPVTGGGDVGVCQAWADGRAKPESALAQRTAFAATASQFYDLGDLTGGARGRVKVRQLLCGRFTVE